MGDSCESGTGEGSGGGGGAGLEAERWCEEGDAAGELAGAAVREAGSGGGGWMTGGWGSGGRGRVGRADNGEAAAAAGWGRPAPEVGGVGAAGDGGTRTVVGPAEGMGGGRAEDEGAGAVGCCEEVGTERERGAAPKAPRGRVRGAGIGKTQGIQTMPSVLPRR